MIEFNEKEKVFYLNTENSSYIFRVTEFNHLESIYYGISVPTGEIESLRLKHTVPIGSSVAYSPENDIYSLDNLTLEYSGIGKGDYRHSPIEICMPDSTYVCDFVYRSHKIYTGATSSETLPLSYGDSTECSTLEITMEDIPNSVLLTMYYTVFPDTDVITRRVIL